MVSVVMIKMMWTLHLISSDDEWNAVCRSYIAASATTRTSITFDPPVQFPSNFVQGSTYTSSRSPYKALFYLALVLSFGLNEFLSRKPSHYRSSPTPESITPAMPALLPYKFRTTSTTTPLTSPCNCFV